jgi:2-methylcitrate dehydratase PrpD
MDIGAAAEATERLAAFAAGLDFCALPPGIILQAQQALLDTVGIALAGAGIGDGFQAAETYLAAQGPGPARIWATGARTSTGAAAFCNAIHARALDYDDIIEHPQVHVSVCVIPAALAMVESCGRPVPGRELIAAIAAGAEIQSRLSAAIAPTVDASRFPMMLATQQFGYFAAAAAAGRILGLSAVQMQDAFGLAMMQTAGTEEMVVHAPLSFGKCLYAGFSNQGGIQSASMARHGVLARGAALTGKAGLFAAFYPGGYEASALTEGLGTRFQSENRCIKAAPGTLVSHAFAEAAQHIMQEHQLAAADIAAVTLHVGGWGQAMCEPSEMRRRPPTSSAAMNSIPFLVAKTLVNGRVALSDVGGAGLAQPEALAMAARIQHRVDFSLNNPGGIEPGVIDITTSSGKTFSGRIDVPRGHPRRPLSFDDMAVKFRDNVGYARHPLSDAQRDNIIDLAGNLPDLADANTLLTAITAQSATRILT